MNQKAFTVDEYHDSLGQTERPIFDVSVSGFIVPAHPELGAFQRSYKDAVCALAKIRGISLSEIQTSAADAMYEQDYNLLMRHETSQGNVKKYASGSWDHLFGPGKRATNCRIAIDLEESKLIAAQEWTGLKFEDVLSERLEDLSESVIEVNEAHKDLTSWYAELTDVIPAWADSGNVQEAMPAHASPDLSKLDDYALISELQRRGMVVQAWSSDDFEFIGNEDEEVIELDLSDEALEKVQQQAFEQARRDLGDIVTARGNEHLGNWWAMNKEPLLAQFKERTVDDSPSPSM